jgi:hypothetical protein
MLSFPESQIDRKANVRIIGVLIGPAVHLSSTSVASHSCTVPILLPIPVLPPPPDCTPLSPPILICIDKSKFPAKHTLPLQKPPNPCPQAVPQLNAHPVSPGPPDFICIDKSKFPAKHTLPLQKPPNPCPQAVPQLNAHPVSPGPPEFICIDKSKFPSDTPTRPRGNFPPICPRQKIFLHLTKKLVS